MTASHPSFFARIGYSFVAFFRTLFSGEFAAIVRDGAPPQLPPPAEPEKEAEPEPEPEPSVALAQAKPDAALQLLAILQREGRFIDFLQEPVQDFDDADIGAAARVVHAGCKKALDAHFTFAPVREEEEETSVTVDADVDPSEVRLTGNVTGEPPFRGSLSHRGWRATKFELPKLSEEHDVTIVAPAEVEL